MSAAKDTPAVVRSERERRRREVEESLGRLETVENGVRHLMSVLPKFLSEIEAARTTIEAALGRGGGERTDGRSEKAEADGQE